MARYLLQEQNDALKNDSLEKVDDASLQGLREMGAFGLQVSQDHGKMLTCTFELTVNIY